MKALQRMFKGLLMLPLVLVGLFVLYEVVGMAVNHAAGARQTAELVRLLERELPQTEILDRLTETGNTSGTGNHVDMLSAVLFRAEAEREDIELVLQTYDSLDEWSFWAEPMTKVQTNRENHPGVYPFLEKMALPENLEHCWLLYRNVSAPFVNNIEGH